MTWNDFFADVERRKAKGCDVVPYPHPALRHQAVPIITFGPEVKSLARLMFEIMYERRGVGLAAPQIGLPLQIFVVNYTVKQKEGSYEIEYDPKKELVFVNPTVEIKKAPNRLKPINYKVDMEGCLSIDGYKGEVSRPNTVSFRAKKVDGADFKGEYGGHVSRIIQHENDHLNGKLFVDILEEKDKEGLPGWLNYLCTQFEYEQKFGTFKSIDEERDLLKELEKLA